MKKQLWALLLIFVLCTVSFPSSASLYVCQNNSCSYLNEMESAKPWLQKLYCFFKARNARIDFCEADSKSRTCLADSLGWYSSSPVKTVFFSIPVARTLPQKNTLLLDYLVRANESLPSCGFALSTFEIAEEKTIRLVSRYFSCNITDYGKTQIQNTFYIDYIDFDNAVLGAKYMIQTYGSVNSNSTGYTMMKFRDGETLLPLVVEPYPGDIPPIPNAAELARLNAQIDSLYSAEAPAANKADPRHPLLIGLDNWWEELKKTFDMDTPLPKTVHEDDHWWTRFVNKFMKVLYFEPLD